MTRLFGDVGEFLLDEGGPAMVFLGMQMPVPLDGGELVANHFLQGFLHAGVAVKAQLRGEPHHGGLADVDRLAQLAGGHERGLVVGL